MNFAQTYFLRFLHKSYWNFMILEVCGDLSIIQMHLIIVGANWIIEHEIVFCLIILNVNQEL
jgi:hypothetical protein